MALLVHWCIALLLASTLTASRAQDGPSSPRLFAPSPVVANITSNATNAANETADALPPSQSPEPASRGRLFIAGPALPQLTAAGQPAPSPLASRSAGEPTVDEALPSPTPTVLLDGLPSLNVSALSPAPAGAVLVLPAAPPNSSRNGSNDGVTPAASEPNSSASMPAPGPTELRSEALPSPSPELLGSPVNNSILEQLLSSFNASLTMRSPSAPSPAEPSPSPPGSPSPSPSPSPFPSPFPSPSPSPPPSPSPSPPPSPTPSPSPSPVARPSPPPSAADTSQSATVRLDLNAKGLTIPRSFLGWSHEWKDLENVGAPGYKELIAKLGSYNTGPFVLRIGGTSTDLVDYVQPPSVWAALSRLHWDTGTKFIIGLNFERADVELARRQQQAATNGLPTGSILNIEIGNEPNYYANKLNKTTIDYLNCCFVGDWKGFVSRLSCRDNSTQDSSCKLNQYTGPVWGHIYMAASTMGWFLRQNYKFLNLVTVHWYKATSETTFSVNTLMDETQLKDEMRHFRELVAVAKGYNLPIRLTEVNTLSNSGKRGVSDVFAAALWTLDSCLELAAAGAAGADFHQGAGETLYAAVLRRYNASGLLPPLVRAPYYAMLMFQQAVSGGAQFIGKQVVSSTNDRIKVFPLMSTDGRQQLRVVIINKMTTSTANVTLDLGTLDNRSTYRLGRVVRLTAEGGLTASSGMQLGGISFAVGGAAVGKEAAEIVERIRGYDQPEPLFSVTMPAASAALLTIDRSS